MVKRDNTNPFLFMSYLRQTFMSLSNDKRKAYAGLLLSALQDAKNMTVEEFEEKYDL